MTRKAAVVDGCPWNARKGGNDMALTVEQRLRRLDLMARVSRSARARADEAAAVIKRSTYAILGGKRSGRTYKISGTRRKYVASAPGEAPASRKRSFRRGWYTKSEGMTPGVATQQTELAKILSKGTRRGLKRRPFVRKIQRRSRRGLRQIYRRPYLE